MANSNAHIITHMKRQIAHQQHRLEFCAVQDQRLYNVLFESDLFAPFRLWSGRHMFTPRSHDHGFSGGFVECYTGYQKERSALVRYAFRLKQGLAQMEMFLVREEAGRAGL